MIRTETEYFGQFYPEETLSDLSERERKRDEFYAVFYPVRIAHALIYAVNTSSGRSKHDGFNPSIEGLNKFFLDGELGAWVHFIRSRQVGVKTISEVLRILRERKELPAPMLDEFESYARKHGKLK